MTGQHHPYTDDGVTYCGWDKIEGCGEVWPCSTVRRAAAELVEVEEYPYVDRWEMVRAYPVISGVLDARLATREQIDAGFRRILVNRNLQGTLRSILDARR